MKIYNNLYYQNKNNLRQTGVHTMPLSMAEHNIEKLPMHYNDYNLMFKAKQTVTEKLYSEKTKLLKNLTEILDSKPVKLTPDQKIIRTMHRAFLTAKANRKRIDELLFEFDLTNRNPRYTTKQKFDKLSQIRNEIKRLEKFKKPKDEPEKKVYENYDYPLINRFKSAIAEDNFNLQDVYLKHYEKLNSIETVAELKEKYPYIKYPPNPLNVMAKKCVNILNRDFYEQLDNIVMSGATDDAITTYIGDALIDGIGDITVNGEYLSGDKVRNFIIAFCDEVLSTYEKIKIENGFTMIPQVRKQYKPDLNAFDINLFHIDYDKFVLHILREQYLEGKKLNEISYTENGYTFIASDLKGSDYKFEKISEKIKKMISDAQKLEFLQRDYKDFTNDELIERLNFYANSELGNIEEIFDIILDFEECKRTPEDIRYLVKFLKELDYLSDNNINAQMAVELIKNKDLRPHGTDKINKAERKAREEKMKLEKLQAIKLKECKKSFNDAIMSLYEHNMSGVIEHCSKYSPKSPAEDEINDAEKIIKIISKNIEQNRTLQQLETEIIQWDLYNQEVKNEKKSEIFLAAEKFSENFPEADREHKIGQYLWNADFVLKYPENKEFFPNTTILEKVVDKYKDDRDTATQLLCKYEDYKLLDENERNSIAKILEIFDNKDVNDKFLLKNIIENEYVYSDTTVKAKTMIKSPDRVFAAAAKQQIMDKYKFPGCISYYKAFEDALAYDAKAQNSSGIKKTGRNNEKLLYRIEAKLVGCTDRLFSSNNNYCFDIYSDIGLH